MEKKGEKGGSIRRAEIIPEAEIGVLYTVMILAILTAGIAIGATVLFKIDTIQVVGNHAMTPRKSFP